MPIVPLHGHSAVTARLLDAFRRGRLPSSLLLHGPAGVGKQRLALHVARTVLCTEADAPCGQCQSCRYAAELQHPDLHWFFPRERPKDPDPDAATVRRDYADLIRSRVTNGGLYPAAPGNEGLHVATTRAIIQSAALSPAISRRKVFIVGDAERMVSQEGADQAANAFLKLLEEPPDDTYLILTSSEPGALIPTIRSRVVPVRVAPLADSEVEEFLRTPLAAGHLTAGSPAELVGLAAGAPGRLVKGPTTENPTGTARRMLDAATARGRAPLYREAFVQGTSKARGDFSAALDALTGVLHERVRRQLSRGDDDAAYRATLAVAAIETASERAYGNVSPQLIAAALLRELRDRVQ